MVEDNNTQYTFKSYVWASKTDIIGAGATSLVYKAISTETGEYVAVKVFNEAAKARANVLQLRELDLLCKIKHENVVKLIDKDDQNGYKYTLKLLVMEYCNGGSLSNIIELPENIYGLNQTEFLLVLKHITCGMNELHKLKIVHRDIKPNNILLQIMPTGEHVYKLSDFGAARQVEMEDDQFTSICGTEEYLFPDVYERALINRNIQRSFKAGIDLWSTGVTLYHVATGLLPFRPIGGRHNRETMIRITKDKPSGAISGVQNPNDHQIEYSERLPDTCQLSRNLQDLLVPMLAGLMENNYDKMWSFQDFFVHSSHIYDLTFIDVMNLDTGSIIELAFEKKEKLANLKEKIEKATKIDKNSQLLIFNNLLFDSLVNENQDIETFPIINKEHPLVLFSLNGTLRCDNLDIIKSIPELRCKSNPKTASEIVHWSKEVCGSIYYIKREVYLVTILIELLKLSAVAFKSYMPEMKLKQQNLLYNFKSAIKSLETKLSIIDKLKSCIKVGQDAKGTGGYHEPIENLGFKSDIKKLKNDISLYESEINVLTEKINETRNYEFLVQNSSLTAKWKNEIDALVHRAQHNYNELLQQKKESRQKQDQERFERSIFTEFKVRQINMARDNAVKLYLETISVHFYDFYSKFEKWMSDLIKLHNDLMSVQQKLIECERSMNAPIDQIDRHLDLKINGMLDTILSYRSDYMNAKLPANALTQRTPPCSPSTTNISSGTTTSSAKTSIDSKLDDKEDNNNVFHSVNSKSSWTNLEYLITSIREFKNQVIDVDRALEDNAVLLRYLQSEFLKKQMNGEENERGNQAASAASIVTSKPPTSS